MNLEYGARKRLSRIVDRHSEEVEETVLEDEGEALATIASNAVFDTLHQDDQLQELVSIAHSAEQVADDRGRPSEDEIADSVDTAWFQIEDALEARAEEVREEVVADVLDREVIRA